MIPPQGEIKFPESESAGSSTAQPQAPRPGISSHYMWRLAYFPLQFRSNSGNLQSFVESPPPVSARPSLPPALLFILDLYELQSPQSRWQSHRLGWEHETKGATASSHKQPGKRLRSSPDTEMLPFVYAHSSSAQTRRPQHVHTALSLSLHHETGNKTWSRKQLS